jgi:hypothetical protein
MSSAGLFLLRSTSGTLMRMRAARVGRWWHVGRRWEKKCDFLHVSLTSRPSRSTLTDGKRQLPSCPRLVSWTPPKLHPYSLDGLPSPDY